MRNLRCPIVLTSAIIHQQRRKPEKVGNARFIFSKRQAQCPINKRKRASADPLTSEIVGTCIGSEYQKGVKGNTS